MDKYQRKELCLFLEKYHKKVWFGLKVLLKRVWLGLKEPSNRFWLFLIPSWILFVFFFLLFLINSGWPPKTPSNKYDLAYLAVSLIFFVLPFVSRMKLGNLLVEFERKLEETRKDLNDFKNQTLQMISSISMNSNTNQNVNIQTKIISKEEVQEPEQKQEPEKEGKTKVTDDDEQKILNTLWSRQVLRFPELNKFWGFKLGRSSPEFLTFREASDCLMAEGLIRETDKGYFFLTKKGLQYCAEHYTEFPDDMWFGYRSFEHNLEKVHKKIESWKTAK